MPTIVEFRLFGLELPCRTREIDYCSPSIALAGHDLLVGHGSTETTVSVFGNLRTAHVKSGRRPEYVFLQGGEECSFPVIALLGGYSPAKYHITREAEE